MPYNITRHDTNLNNIKNISPMPLVKSEFPNTLQTLSNTKQS